MSLGLVQEIVRNRFRVHILGKSQQHLLDQLIAHLFIRYLRHLHHDFCIRFLASIYFLRPYIDWVASGILVQFAIELFALAMVLLS